MKKLLSLTLTLCLGASLLTGCSSQQPASKPSLDKLTLTYVTSPLNVPSIVEKNNEVLKTSFADLGTSVEYAEITSGADQTQALASGDVQILNAVGATSVILSAANGADIKVLSMYSRSPKAFCMYSKDESITAPEHLRGKTIAGPVGTNLHQLLIAYLNSAGMTIDDVNYVSMSIPDSKAGLDGGSVDVALIAGPTAYNAGLQGYHLVADGEGYIDAIIAVAVTETFYQSHKDVIDTFLAAQAEVATFIKNNQDETMDMLLVIYKAKAYILHQQTENIPF